MGVCLRLSSYQHRSCEDQGLDIQQDGRHQKEDAEPEGRDRAAVCHHQIMRIRPRSSLPQLTRLTVTSETTERKSSLLRLDLMRPMTNSPRPLNLLKRRRRPSRKLKAMLLLSLVVSC